MSGQGDSAGGDQAGDGRASGPLYVWLKGEWRVAGRWTHE